MGVRARYRNGLVKTFRVEKYNFPEVTGKSETGMLFKVDLHDVIKLEVREWDVELTVGLIIGLILVTPIFGFPVFIIALVITGTEIRF
jgi:hypothetical protein